MSNEGLNSVIDRAEDEYQKLKDKVIEQGVEIERLNKGYCKFKEECGKYATCLRENQLKEIERLNNIINEVREKLNTQLAFTSSYQLNYQSAMSIIEEAKSTLRGVDKN